MTPAARGACPSPDHVVSLLAGLNLERASRTARFGNDVPLELYRRAAERPGRPVASHEGAKGLGALVAGLPIAQLWAAVNDLDHYALEDDYIPVQHSEVLGPPDERGHLLFQVFQRWGVGRWWVSRIRTNKDLFLESDGMLWELSWTDEIADVDTDKPPVSGFAARIRPLESSHGSWLMVPLADDCTAVEYFTHSELGGIVGMGQTLMAKRGVSLTMEGLVRMASEHIPSHDSGDFVRPDGTPLDSSPSDSSREDLTPAR
jgi:hypothetical protein